MSRTDIRLEDLYANGCFKAWQQITDEKSVFISDFIRSSDGEEFKKKLEEIRSRHSQLDKLVTEFVLEKPDGRALELLANFKISSAFNQAAVKMPVHANIPVLPTNADLQADLRALDSAFSSENYGPRTFCFQKERKNEAEQNFLALMTIRDMVLTVWTQLNHFITQLWYISPEFQPAEGNNNSRQALLKQLKEQAMSIKSAEEEDDESSEDLLSNLSRSVKGAFLGFLNKPESAPEEDTATNLLDMDQARVNLAKRLQGQIVERCYQNLESFEKNVKGIFQKDAKNSMLKLLEKCGDEIKSELETFEELIFSKDFFEARSTAAPSKRKDPRDAYVDRILQNTGPHQRSGRGSPEQKKVAPAESEKSHAQKKLF